MSKVEKTAKKASISDNTSQVKKLKITRCGANRYISMKGFGEN